MNVEILEQERDRLASELAAKRQMQAVESDLQKVEAQLQQETKRRYALRSDWLNRMKTQQQNRLKAEQAERELLAEINKVLLPLLEQLADARERKTDAVLHIIGIFESEHTSHNFNREATAQHFYSTMKELGIDVSQFPQWAAKRRLHGDFFRSEYKSPNTGRLAVGIDQCVEAVKK